ncbi:MAG: M48 family metallopeptidase [bacterium]
MKTQLVSRILNGALTAACLASFACSTGRLPDHRGSNIPFTTLEEKLNHPSTGLPEDRSQLYQDPALLDYLRNVMEILLPEHMRADEGSPFFVFVLKDPFLEALSLPEGGICITTGLLARLENEAQLAMVLAHELAHGLGRPGLPCMRMSSSEQRASPFIGKHGQRIAEGSPQDFADAVRNCEREADRVGMSLIRRAGYDPAEARRLLFLLQQEAEESFAGESASTGRLRTDLQERIQILSEMVEEDPDTSRSTLRKSDSYARAVEDLLLENASLDLEAGRLRSAQRSLERYRSLRPDDARTQEMLEELARRRTPAEKNASARAPAAQILAPTATIQIPPGWKRVTWDGPLLVTKDGAMQQYVLVQEIHVDRGFPHTEKRLRRGMLPREAAAVISDEIASDRAVLDFELLENRPVVVDHHEGFRLVFTYRTKEGRPFRTLYYGFLRGDRLHSIRFNAIDPDMFQRDLASFQEMTESLRWTDPPFSSESSDGG